MYKTDALERYTGFVNEVLDIARTKGLEIGDQDPLRKKWKVSSTLLTYMKVTKMIYFGSDGVWYTNIKDPIPQDDVARLKEQFNQYRRDLKTKKEPPVEYKSELSFYTGKQLIDELKRRGYSGTLTFTKEIKF